MVAISKLLEADTLTAAAPGTGQPKIPEPPSTQKASLSILADITAAQSAHGLKHSDYARYRRYCTRRLARLRSTTRTTNRSNQNGRRYVEKPVTADVVANDPRALAVPLVLAERDWAFAMDVKRTQPAGAARARRALLAKLSRAVRHAHDLASLARQTADENTVLEAAAYAQSLIAALALEREAWQAALTAYDDVRKIYSGIAGVRAGTTVATLFETKLEDVNQAIRFCRYNIARHGDVGDANGGAEEGTLLQSLRADNLASSDMLAEKIEAALAEARKRAAVSFGHVEWCGRRVALRSERVREAVLTAVEENKVFGTKESTTVDEYDGLFVVLNDAIKIVMKETAEFRNTAADDRVKELEMLSAFLSHSRLQRTAERNLLLVKNLRSKRGGKSEDFVRLYDNLIGNMTEILALRGADEDASISNEAEARRGLFRANRCFHLAQCYLAVGLQAEAAALFDRVTVHAKTLSGAHAEEAKQIVAESTGMKCRAKAEAYLKECEVSDEVSQMRISDAHLPRKKLMINNLDEYAAFALSGDAQRSICDMPPALEAVSCKPVLFDLAIDGVKFPTMVSQADEALVNDEARSDKPGEPAEEEPDAAKPSGFVLPSTRLGRWWTGRT